MRRLFVFTLATALLFVTPSVFAQETSANSSEESSDWYYDKLIRSVSFKGLKSVSNKEVDGITSGFIGRRFSDDLFADMIDRIYALELFDEISPEALPGDARRNTVSIVFTVKERPTISRIQFKGNRAVRSAEVKEAASIREKDVFVESKLLADERAIRNMYLEKGFTNATVSSSYQETTRGIEVTFNIEEGRSTVIAHLEFRGNKVFSSSKLRGKLKLKEVGLFNKGAFQESMLEIDKQMIVANYQNSGYVDAQVIDVIREVAINEEKKRDELTITFVIQEGTQYVFNGVSFVGNTIFTDEKLQSLFKLPVGKVFNQTKFQEGAMAVTDLYYENGYTSNRFQPIPTKDSSNKTISYVFQIVENERSHIETVIVKGNTRTKEYVIRREIPLESGDILSKAKVMNGLRNLLNLQYFSAVVPDIVPGSEQNLVDLVYTVEEQSTTSIEFGVTFSGVSDPDDLPFALFVKWQDSNLKGTGKALSIGSTVATDEQSVSISYGQSWLWGLPISTEIGTSFSHSSLTALRLKWFPDGRIDDDSYYMDYDQWRWSLSYSMGHRWTPDFAILTLHGGVTGSLVNNVYDEKLYTPVDTVVSEYANEWGWQNSIWTSFSVDARDISYDPSRGWFASQRLTWYGLIPIEREYFLRTDTKLEKYFTLINWAITEKWHFKLVLAGYTGLSLQFPAPNTAIGDSSRLSIDGMFNGRGWSISNTVRGKALWSSNVELRMPVVPGVLALDGWADAAVVTKEVYQLQNLTAEDFYFSLGPGIRFTIPQFPLRLLFANTFRIVNGERVWDDTWKFVLSFTNTNR